ncbi:unnamed protein product, partial [Mycena citricolor]
DHALSRSYIYTHSYEFVLCSPPLESRICHQLNALNNRVHTYDSSFSAALILSHHSFVTLFSFSRRSSSASKLGSCDFLNVESSKSLKSLIVSRPELRDNATYTLNRFSPPLGGVAMSTRTFFNVCPWDR